MSFHVIEQAPARLNRSELAVPGSAPQMFEKAAKAVGANYTDLNNGNMNSMELETTNKVSPVAAPKRNKYGV